MLLTLCRSRCRCSGAYDGPPSRPRVEHQARVPPARSAPGEPGWPVLGGVGRVAHCHAGGMVRSAGESRMKHAARCSCRAGAPGPCFVRTEPTRPPHRRGSRPARAAPLRCAGSPCPRCLPCPGLAAVSRGRRPRRPWHTWRSELLSETLVCACMHGCVATRLGAEHWSSRWSILSLERDLKVG